MILRVVSLMLLFCVSVLIKLGCGYSYETVYFKQKVDHFAYENDDHFIQRYLVNSQHWNSQNGSVFFYTGNEGDITMFANNTGFMWENAEKFSALLVFAEHRYYGESLPYGMESLKDPKHRGYLTSEQALADFAVLISHLKNIISGARSAPVVVFGGSYGGMLAAWMRIKYPHLVIGAVASSAPVLQFVGLTPCEKYGEIITNDFALYGSECTESIRKSWKIIRETSKTWSGIKWISQAFNLCATLSSAEISNFIQWLSETWSYLAMTNYPYATDFILPLPPYPIREACSKLKNSSASSKELIQNIFNAVSVFRNYSGSVQCFNISQPTSKYLGDNMWDYQACTEMVMPMCYNGVSDMFEPLPWNVTLYSETCWGKWQVKPEVEKVIIVYGGRNISASSNIIFSNGDLDPWSSGGILKSISDTIIAIRISNAAHHLDLRASNPNDPLSVINARHTILKWISRWIYQSKKY